MDTNPPGGVVETFENTVNSLRPALIATIARGKTPRLSRAKYAVFEATRPFMPAATSRAIWFYRSFMGINLLVPVVIVAGIPDRYWPFSWDIWGVASTVTLVLFTYGTYVASAIKRLFQGLRGTSDQEEESDISLGEHRQRMDLALINSALCFVGFLVTSVAVVALILNETHKLSGDFRTAGIWFFVYLSSLMAIASLFLFIDRNAAELEVSHSETFRAVSSLVYASLPILFGIFCLWVYSGAIVVRAMVTQGYLDFSQIPTGFISGALSFQMIVSNILFIKIKRDKLIEHIYKYVERTRID